MDVTGCPPHPATLKGSNAITELLKYLQFSCRISTILAGLDRRYNGFSRNALNSIYTACCSAQVRLKGKSAPDYFRIIHKIFLWRFEVAKPVNPTNHISKFYKFSDFQSVKFAKQQHWNRDSQNSEKAVPVCSAVTLIAVDIKCGKFQFRPQSHSNSNSKRMIQ